MKKTLAILLSALLVVAVMAIPVGAVNWEDGQTRVENTDGSLGNYTFDNAYGYVFNIGSVNGTIAGEDVTIITSEEEYNAANPNWAISVLLAPTSEANVYEVVTVVVTPGSEGLEKGINFDNGNICLIVHSSGSLPEATNDKGELQQFPNWEAKVAAMALKVGDKVTLAGIDLEAGTATEATATVQDAPEGYEVTNGVDKEPEVEPAEPKMFWVTHLNDSSVEGAGVIFTEAYTGCAWWKHFAFSPIADAENSFELTAIVDGPALNGTGVEPLAIPEGGFVYAINVGNNWKDLCEENGVTGDGSTGLWYDDEFHASEPNYATANVSAMWEDVATWTVGMQITIDGIDFANIEVPTSTAEVKWYDEAYVCTSTYAPYVEGGDVQPPVEDDPEVSLEDELKEALGEANADAKFDLEINAPETYKAGDEITVTVTVKNITAENGLHVVNFTLQYDYEKLELTNDL
ncbi:MAG: hypothetical protein IKK70_05410, partial [Clostridia bacterium]|nr:hypothetical protein [Clostridia bacterium]